MTKSRKQMVLELLLDDWNDEFLGDQESNKQFLSELISIDTLRCIYKEHFKDKIK